MTRSTKEIKIYYFFPISTQFFKNVISPKIQNFHLCWWLNSEVRLVFAETPQKSAVLVSVGTGFQGTSQTGLGGYFATLLSAYTCH